MSAESKEEIWWRTGVVDSTTAGIELVSWSEVEAWMA